MPAILAEEVARRRTFAIISHPDAGKTHADAKKALCCSAAPIPASPAEVKGPRKKSRIQNPRSDWMKQKNGSSEGAEQRHLGGPTSVMNLRNMAAMSSIMLEPRGGTGANEDRLPTDNLPDA